MSRCDALSQNLFFAFIDSPSGSHHTLFLVIHSPALPHHSFRSHFVCRKDTSPLASHDDLRIISRDDFLHEGSRVQMFHFDGHFTVSDALSDELTRPLRTNLRVVLFLGLQWG